MSWKGCFMLLLFVVSSSALFENYDNCAFMDTDLDFKLFWTLEQNQIKMAVSVNKLTPTIDPWAAIGFSKTESEAMISDGKCSDALIVSQVTGGCSNAPTSANCTSNCLFCHDDVSICSKPPVGQAGNYILTNFKDTVHNFQLSNVQVVQAVFSFEFTRALNTGDSNDVVIAPSSPHTIIWALGEKPTNEYLKHRADTRGQISVIFSEKSSCNTTDGEIKNSLTFVSPSGDYSVSWSIDTDATEITVEVKAKTSGWAAFGIGKDSTMPETDVVVGYFDTSNNFVIFDGYNFERGKPGKDAERGGTSDIKNFSGSRNGDLLTFKFTKTFNPNDPNDIPITKGVDSYLLYALGPVDSTGIRTHVEKGSSKVDFFGGSAPVTSGATTLKKVHGSLMLIGWTICLGTGILVANKIKRKVETWFYLHVGFQVVGSLILLAGIIVIFQEYDSTFAGSSHAYVGLTVFSGMLLQIVFGIITNRVPATRHVLHFLHRWLGRVIFPLAFAAILLGINAISGSTELYILVGVWFFVFLIVLCIPYKGTMGDNGIEMGGDKNETKMEKAIPPRTRNSFIAYTVISTILVIALIVLLFLRVENVASSGSVSVDSSKYLDIRFSNYSLPKQQTSYKCISLQISSKSNRDATRLTPIVDNKKVVHHMILFNTGTFISKSEPVWDCAQMPSGTPVWVWAAGGGDFEMPSDVGQRYGPKEIENVVLQIHYDMSYTNDYSNTNELDSSGVRITFSDNLQQYQMGVVRLGVPMSKINLDPGKEEVTLKGNCPGSATKGLKNPLNVFSTALHMHFIGKKIWVDHIRNGASIGKVSEVTKWDFNNQQFMYANTTIKAGDTLETTCVWDTTTRTTVTNGGEDSVKEMCFAFLFFYPRIQGDPQACGA